MPRTTPEILDRRALNRAVLARQLLLRRVKMAPGRALEHLVGMQAQEPTNPYVGLWSRVDGFRPEILGRMIASRRAARMALMRATLHLATARDCRALRALMAPVLERMFRVGSPFGRKLAGASRPFDLAAVLAAGRALLDERPRTSAELRPLLAARWPDLDAAALTFAVTYLVPVVQIPPRGIWGESGQARWATMASWLGETPYSSSSSAVAAALEALVLRYLRAFGPASVADVQAWCGLTHLRETVERLRPRLRTFRDERGKLLFDLPRAPRPPGATPAPPRFLPEYDNVLLGHADRGRMIDPGTEADVRRLYGADERGVGHVLIDGVLRASWRVELGRSRAHLTLRLFERPSPAQRSALREEGDRLLAFWVQSPVAADARSRGVGFDVV